MMLIRVLLFALLCVLAPLGGAAPQEGAETPPPPGVQLEGWNEEASDIERALEEGDLEIVEVDRMRRRLDGQLDEIQALQQTLRTQLEPLRKRLEALAPPEEGQTETPTPESARVAKERSELGERIAELDGLLKRADSAEVRANTLLNRLTEERRQMFTAQLLARGPSLLEPGTAAAGIEAIGRTANVIRLETGYRIERQRMGTSLFLGLVVPLLIVIGAFAVLFRVKNALVRRLAGEVTPETVQSRRVGLGLALTLTRLLLPAAGVGILIGAAYGSGLFGGQGQLLLEGIAKGAAMLIGAYALSGAFFAPKAPLLRLSILEDTDARAAHRGVMLLAVVIALDFALVRQGQTLGLAVEALSLFNTLLLAFGGIALWNLMGCLRPPARAEPEPRPGGDAQPDEEGEDEGGERRGSVLRPALIGLRLVARFVAVVAPLLALTGYFAGARYLFYPLIFSLGVLGICILLYHVVQGLVARLAVPGEAAEGEEGALPRARLQLIPLLVGLLLASAAVPVIALIWGAAPEDILVLWRSFAGGVQVGEVTLSPIDFLTFIVVIAIGLVITERLKAMLRRSVLPLTGLDQGARDAAAAGAGYLGLIIAALVAVSAAGIDLSNLAIVAGALSVGIGFGLQNIVNNFVSGVILLVERPIKAGDWIELPSGMGYVRNINVRSTEIETFDRSSLFVPNSQLISENVINWTHGNLHGRIIVKVGVSYDSDPRQVERILLEIARGHPLMLRRPAPYVLFRGFGADALEFEIRGILRDVNWILNVQSDINFEIARRFSEAGVQVPFKQADIKLKNPDEIATALAALNAGRAAGPDAETPETAPRAAGPAPRPPLSADEPARDPDADGAGGGDR